MITSQEGATDGTSYAIAEHAARSSLLNCLVREVHPLPAQRQGPVYFRLASGVELVARLQWWSISGNHRWEHEIEVDRGTGRRSVAHADVVHLLLDEVGAAVGAGKRIPQHEFDALLDQIANSVERTANFLSSSQAQAPSVCGHEITRRAEQSLILGHPFHPTPKSADGPLASDLARFAPELGTSFQLHYMALSPEVVAGERVGPGQWIPAEVLREGPSGWPVVPVHPLQAKYLQHHPVVSMLVADGALIPLGPIGSLVYPTSSVRTVCNPAFPTAWKLPLHLRITNFTRNIPTEHARRAADASALVARLRSDWRHSGFGVLSETGWQGLNPLFVGEELAAESTVIYRDNPFATGSAAPRVLAALVEAGSGSKPPTLVDEVRRARMGRTAWLEAYLRISLVPLLEVFGSDGLGFEAHLQNSLLHTEAGRPAQFWVRDMEGAHVSRDRLPAGLAADSPLVYTEDDAWQRLRYHAVVNQLAGVVSVLGHAERDEHKLWCVVAGVLASLGDSSSASPYAEDLLCSQTLPAKANLVSRLVGSAESPRFVEIPNPIRICRP
ncbi:IucA/IucC family protein [Rhodococcus sp. NPDC060176]|uniref:IucA/IucC family protein n=1 Tax=Rhodococcus sp. NPDC060176 TaxID=3347062 RepID=UPI0036655FA3